MKTNLKMSLWLTAACFIAFLLALPYTTVTLGGCNCKSESAYAAGTRRTSDARHRDLIFMAWIGLTLGTKVGLDAPILRSWVIKSKEAAFEKDNVLRAVVLGALASIIAVSLELFWFQKAIPELKGLGAQVSFWKGALTAFQGGIYEEIMLRLFLMTLIVWILSKFTTGYLYWKMGFKYAVIAHGVGDIILHGF